MISWSPNPGCFERHLQRKSSFPILFSLDCQPVSADAVREAKERDAQDYAQLLTDMSDFSVPHPLLFKHLRSLIEQNVALERKAAAIGGEAMLLTTAFRAAREALLQQMKETMVEHGEPIDEGFFETMSTLSDVEVHPFFAQCGRKDSPIAQDDEVSVLLLEPIDIVSQVMIVMKHMNPQVVAPMRSRALALARLAVRHGTSIPDLNLKLRAFGVPKHKIVLNVVPWRMLHSLGF
jgi:hypothetical protein